MDHKNYEHEVAVGAPADENDAEIVSYNESNSGKTEFYNYVGRADTLGDVESAGLVPAVRFAYNKAATPVGTSGTTLVTIPPAPAGAPEALFGSLSANAQATLDLGEMQVEIPNVALETTDPTVVAVVLQDRTTFEVTIIQPGNVVQPPVAKGHSGPLASTERRLRVLDHF